MDFTRAMSSLNFGCKFLLIAKKYNLGQKETKIGSGTQENSLQKSSIARLVWIRLSSGQSLAVSSGFGSREHFLQISWSSRTWWKQKQGWKLTRHEKSNQSRDLTSAVIMCYPTPPRPHSPCIRFNLSQNDQINCTASPLVVMQTTFTSF